MPEGDTVWRQARQLHQALAGAVLTRTDFRVPQFAVLDLSGNTVDEVVSRGKHLLIRVGRHTIHSHLKMEGSWEIYAVGERWRKPGFQARAVLQTQRWQAVGFQLGFLRVIARGAEDQAVGYLGPDLLGPDWDAAEALRRLLADPARPIGLALLDQHNLAGVGNIYRCELCFLAGVHPLTPVGAVPNLPRMVDQAKRLLEANKTRSVRATTGNLRGDTYWVYRREHRGCLRCGTRVILEKLGDSETELRDLYYCPHCQPFPAPAAVPPPPAAPDASSVTGPIPPE